jgi:hypothetical protein
VPVIATYGRNFGAEKNDYRKQTCGGGEGRFPSPSFLSLTIGFRYITRMIRVMSLSRFTCKQADHLPPPRLSLADIPSAGTVVAPALKRRLPAPARLASAVALLPGPPARAAALRVWPRLRGAARAASVAAVPAA